MSVLEEIPSDISAPGSAPGMQSLPVLRELPQLLEYRSESDADDEFIPKTVAGFGLGAVAMFICLDIAEMLLMHRGIPVATQLPRLGVEFVVFLGLTFVATSLLLVGLKFRSDHSDVQLFARHWLVSITTGSVYAFMLWAPWTIRENFSINKFVAAAVFMVLFTFPALAARWMIAPHKEYARSLA